MISAVFFGKPSLDNFAVLCYLSLFQEMESSQKASAHSTEIEAVPARLEGIPPLSSHDGTASGSVVILLMLMPCLNLLDL
jgi:hypothetical protein